MIDHSAWSARSLSVTVMLHGGSGVTPGWQTEPEAWARLLEQSMHKDFVLQKRLYPHTELFPSDDGPVVEPRDAEVVRAALEKLIV